MPVSVYQTAVAITNIEDISLSHVTMVRGQWKKAAEKSQNTELEIKKIRKQYKLTPSMCKEHQLNEYLE